MRRQVKQLVLDALYRSAERKPEIIPLLTGKAAAFVKLIPLNRAALERKLARVITSNQRAELDKLLRLLGDPPDLSRVNDEYWQNASRSLQSAIEPVLVETFVQQAAAMLDTISIGVDWTLINTNAVRWASQYTYDLVHGITDVSRRALQEIIPRFYTDGWSMGDLYNALESTYGKVRAEMIAVTETTRASVEGERAIMDALNRESGVQMVPIWQTSNDEASHKCPLCGPRHGKPIQDNMFPPAHPRCRCWVIYDYADNVKP